MCVLEREEEKTTETAPAVRASSRMGVNKFDELGVVKTVRLHSDFLTRNVWFV